MRTSARESNNKVHGNDAKNAPQPAGPKLVAKNPPFSCRAKMMNVATKKMSKNSNTALMHHERRLREK